MRAHFTRPVTDQQGDLLVNVQVYVYEPATTTAITEVLYSTDIGNNVLNNPFVSDTGIIDLYLDAPKRVRLGVVQGGLPIQYYENVDILGAGLDSQHVGTGLLSLVIGNLATSAGNSSTAVGPGANSTGANSTAVGNAASTFGVQSVAVGPATVQGVAGVAIGSAAQATGDNSVVVGQGATAAMSEGTAVGHGATAVFAHSTAIGPGAVTTGPNQVMLGTATDTVELPFGSGLVLQSANGSRFKVTVDNSGSLVTTVL